MVSQVRWLTHTGSPCAALRAKTKQPLTPGSINHNTVAHPQTAWLPLAPRALARGDGGGGVRGKTARKAVGVKERKGAKVQRRKGGGSCTKIRENLAETALPAALDLHPIKPR